MPRPKPIFQVIAERYESTVHDPDERCRQSCLEDLRYLGVRVALTLILKRLRRGRNGAVDWTQLLEPLVGQLPPVVAQAQDSAGRSRAWVRWGEGKNYLSG